MGAKIYRDLHQRLELEGRDSMLARHAKVLAEEGKLEEAGEALDRLLASGERLVEQVASDHFNRAVVYALQFQLHKALPHYKKAYRYSGQTTLNMPSSMRSRSSNSIAIPRPK